MSVRIPIVSGVIAESGGGFLTSYPVNREPVVKDLGISEGFLAVPPGIALRNATGLGEDRGGFNWNDVCYRVIGTKLVRVNADFSISVLGDVGGSGPVGFDASFDNLIINSGTSLYYYNDTNALRKVTDSNLGTVVDAIWADGYTMTTDGEFLIVTDLNDPMVVQPLKYGSAEDSPDPVTGLIRMHGEVYAFGGYTTQVYQNIGGLGFPFQTVKTATVPYGCVGPRAKCKFMGTVAFVGSQQNGQNGVYLLGSGDATKISPQEVDDDIAALTDAERAAIWVESRVMGDDRRLLVHLPTKTWGFSEQATRRGQAKAWCQYVTSSSGFARYEGRGLVYCYGKWIVGSSSGQIGTLDHTIATHYGQDVGWQFDTSLIYNEGRRGLLTGIVLTGTPGRGNDDSRVFFSYTKDGQSWSMERETPSGRMGQTTKRVAWRPGIRFEQYMGLRFRGCDGSVMSIARLDCEIEAMG